LTSESQQRRLDRAVDGDGEALAQLLAEHAPAVRRNVESGIPQKWQAVLSIDDVMQETYIDAFLDIGHFDPRGEGAFVAWLTTLAKRNLLDALRMLEAEKRGRNHRRVQPVTREGSLIALSDRLAAPGSTPSHRVARSEAHTSLQRAIERLPETYRTVVEMYDLGGQSAEEIAGVLELSVGAVYMRRARAHRQLCSLMGDASRFLTGTR
jgi:RNA polymerase sigma-70 factor (ECF subfamily)